MSRKLIQDSKYLALVLRHKPQEIGLTLDEHGWADIDTLLACFQAKRKNITYEELMQIVDTDNKKRYTLSEDGKKIRAAQGHSINIDLELKPEDPPEQLFHGTAERFLSSIMAIGLTKQKRQYVHLSPNIETAVAVGKRHGKPAVLQIDVDAMKQNGKVFYKSENDVWLSECVEPCYLKRIQ